MVGETEAKGRADELGAQTLCRLRAQSLEGEIEGNGVSWKQSFRWEVREGWGAGKERFLILDLFILKNSFERERK